MSTFLKIFAAVIAVLVVSINLNPYKRLILAADLSEENLKESAQERRHGKFDLSFGLIQSLLFFSK